MSPQFPGYCLRIDLEAQELERLALQAARSAESAGRDRPEEPCRLRTAFQRDRDRILHAKAFRRLKDKTQVFIAPEGAHFRTRMTHTMEVSQVSRTVARALRLNEDLTEAIALGHDFGHTPFGHSGEHVLARMLPGGFQHNLQSVRVVEVLEPLNLTAEVRDGLAHHTGHQEPATLEGQIVRIGDRVAYLNHDVDDALRGGVLREEDLPASYRALGDTLSQRLGAMIRDLIEASWATGLARICMSPEMWELHLELRQFMFRRVYTGSAAKREEKKAQALLHDLFQHYLDHPQEVLDHLGPATDPDPVRAVADYVAGMTDRYAMAMAEELFSPKPWRRLASHG